MSNITQKMLFDEYKKWIAGGIGDVKPLETPTQANHIREIIMNDNRLDGINKIALSALIDEQLLNIAAINNKVFLTENHFLYVQGQTEYLS